MQTRTPAHACRSAVVAASAAFLVGLFFVVGVTLPSVGCTGGDKPTTASTAPATSEAEAPAPTTSTTAGATSATARVPVQAIEGEVVLSAPYGGDPGQFGFIPANESIADGPRAFWPLATGDLYILDPVNRRVQLAPPPRGGDARAIPITDALAPRDLAVAADGTLVIDDSDGSATYQAYSASGELRDSVESAFGQVISAALASDGALIYAQMATGVSGQDHVYVPLYEGGGLLDPEDQMAAAGTRVPLGGGWSAEVGTRSTEEAAGVPAGTLRIYDGAALLLQAVLEPAPLGEFVLQRTATGGLIASALSESEPAIDGTGGGSGGTAPVRMVWVFDRRGELVARARMPLEQNVVDTFVTPVRATPAGALYTLSTDSEGLTIRRYQVE